MIPSKSLTTNLKEVFPVVEYPPKAGELKNYNPFPYKNTTLFSRHNFEPAPAKL